MMKIDFDKRTEEQKADFARATQAGMVRHIAELNGGTGDLRRKLSEKEVAKLKSRRGMAKVSRRKNRRGRR